MAEAYRPPAGLYPFESHWLDLDGHRLHYLDEGPRDAPPLLMLHGNPTWSFYYRNLVLALRDRYRCIVPDHIGCGLSDKPGDDTYDYHLAQRVADVGRLVDHLDPGPSLGLVVHDWGGMIGFAWAAQQPDRIDRCVVMNTAAFPIPDSKRLPLGLWLAGRTPLGAPLVRGLNAFSGLAARVAFKKPVSAEVRQAFTGPYDSWNNRIATLRFVQDIPLRPGERGHDLVAVTGERLSAFADTPCLLAWGLRDFVFDHHFLEEWQRRLPHAEVHRYEDCGHYILEDAAPGLIDIIAEFLDRQITETHEHGLEHA